MTSTVYFGSARQCRLEAKETLPVKLDLILERLNLRERVKGETVAIKMHTGNKIGYSTAHPVFVRKIVQAVEEDGDGMSAEKARVTSAPFLPSSSSTPSYASFTLLLRKRCSWATTRN